MARGDPQHQTRPNKLLDQDDPYVKAMEARDQRIRDLEHRLQVAEDKNRIARRVLSDEAEDRKPR
jgi:hypothetical protein